MTDETFPFFISHNIGGVPISYHTRLYHTKLRKRSVFTVSTQLNLRDERTEERKSCVSSSGFFPCFMTWLRRLASFSSNSMQRKIACNLGRQLVQIEKWIIHETMDTTFALHFPASERASIWRIFFFSDVRWMIEKGWIMLMPLLSVGFS